MGMDNTRDHCVLRIGLGHRRARRPESLHGGDDRFVRAYAEAQNDMAKGATRQQRAKAICAAIKSPMVRDWIGTVYKLSSNNEGKGVLGFDSCPTTLWVKTHNNAFSDTGDHTLIDPESPVFAKAVALKEHQRVRFSAVFFPIPKTAFARVA